MPENIYKWISFAGLTAPFSKGMTVRPRRKQFYLISLLCFTLLILNACGGRPIRLDDSVTSRIVRENIVNTALKMRGKPYSYGGASPAGFDCSGLVLYSYNQSGIAVPRSTREQLRKITPVHLNDLRPGDLLFYRISNSIVSHVGIFIGNNQFVHAPSTGKTVTITNMNDHYWQQRFVGAGTLIR